MATAKLQLKNFFNRIAKLQKEAISKDVMRDLAEFTREIIIKRTRLGYGVTENLGTKAKLKALSPNYIKQRLQDKRLSSTTSAKKSNLTRYGIMLQSVKVKKIQNGKVTLGPTGSRPEGTNEQIAIYNAERGRVFLRLSRLEFNQVLRLYRKYFGDLRKKLSLLR